MNHHDRLLAINATVIHLEWLTTPARYRTALDLLADTGARTTIAVGGRDAETQDRRAIGSHSDPTSTTAGTHLAQAERDTRTARDLQLTARAVIDCARHVRRTTAGLELPDAGNLSQALADLRWSTTVPHVVTARRFDEPVQEELDHAIVLGHTQASSLAAAVGTVLRSAVRPPAEKPVQKALDGCRSCARFGIFTPVAESRYRHWCRRCGEFRTAQGCMPSEMICRTWDSGSSRITPGMIIEAKATVRGKRRKRSA